MVNILLDLFYKIMDASDKYCDHVNAIIFGVDNVLFDPFYKTMDTGVIILCLSVIIFD